jgi:hypothetical protein
MVAPLSAMLAPMLAAQGAVVLAHDDRDLLLAALPLPADRPAARPILRQAAAMLAAGWLDRAVGLRYHHADDAAPRLVDSHGSALPCSVSVSLSHASDGATGLGLVALHRGGKRLGIDLCSRQAPPEWPTLAALYLGPASTLPDAGAFAPAWAALEAACKATGLPLAEWHPDRARHLARCRVQQIPLPAPWSQHWAAALAVDA